MNGISSLLWIAIIALLVVGVYFGAGFNESWSIWDGCTWQPDYCFASCVEDVYGSTTQQVYPAIAFQCPSGADVHECVVQSVPNGAINPGIYSSCTQGWLGDWSCTGMISTAYPGAKVGRGQYFWFGGSVTIPTGSIKTVKKILMRCGTAACTGGGSPIAGAQGCSWNPGSSGYVWEDGTTGAKSVPFGQGFPYVCSQHLVSCPSSCTDPMACSVPQNLKNFVMTYNGQQHKAYVTCIGSECTTQVVGCKTQTYTNVCIKKDAATGVCTEYGTQEYGECGTIATLPAGQCAQDSDCGTGGTYYCDWDSESHTGTCKPYQTHECTYDYDCDQTGSGCFNRQIATIKCVDGMCKKTTINVGCCTSSDCAPGYYCTYPGYECEPSQEEKPDCTFECCDSKYNEIDASYKQKPCPAAEPICCGDHTCAANVEACGAHPPGPDETDLNAIWILIFTALFAAIGYWKKEYIGAIIGGIGGLIIGILVYSFLSMAWWQQGIIFLIFGGAAVLVGYVAVLAIPLIIAAILVLK